MNHCTLDLALLVLVVQCMQWNWCFSGLCVTTQGCRMMQNEAFHWFVVVMVDAVTGMSRLSMLSTWLPTMGMTAGMPRLSM